MTHQNPKIDEYLERFGLASFRSGQREVIQAVLDGHDTLCIMPTGGGKSLCFQLPTLMRDGVTIVISPLIALMKDQVDALTQRGIPATFINSSLAPAQQHARIEGMERGEYKLVYIAPERLRSSSFSRAISRTPIQLLAIDEAHCISQWGHDFRPDYARLGRFRERMGHPQTVALTATATRLVRDDIVGSLQLQAPASFVSGFARDNLALQVVTPEGNSDKDNRLIEFLENHNGSGIIYASTRKVCERLMELLCDSIRRPVAFYHAGLPADARREVQEKFMDGEIPIIIATNAFGMGIDKPDLRFVIHYNLPGSIEAYYQEAGRAGRDGLPSVCQLLYSYQDKFVQEFFIENSYPSRETIRDIYEFLRTLDCSPIEMTLQEIKEELDLSIGTSGIATCENLLEKAGAIERLDTQQNMAGIRIDSELSTLIDLLPRDARVQRHVMRGLEKITGSIRGERVMFRPQKLADLLDMKWPAVNRTIRQLVRLEQVDFVPPFRGRAIHLLCPDKSFPQLEIDFGELERRKKSEYEKLQTVIDLCTTRRCRQMFILDYFGDPDQTRCGICDNCQSATTNSRPQTDQFQTDACLYATQVALSGAARTGGRVGKTLIAQMLKGSEAKKVRNLGLDRLSTFGLLNSLRQSDITGLIDWLIECGYLKQTENTKFRPVVTISSSGKQVMSGSKLDGVMEFMPSDLINTLAKKFAGRRPHQAVGFTAAPKPDDDFLAISTHEPELTESTPSAESSPAAIRPLPLPAELATEVPTEAPEADREARQSQTGKEAFARLDPPEPDVVQPNFYWTWRLFTDGYSAEQIQQVRHIDRMTILDHLGRALDDSLEVDAGWVLSEAKREILDNFIAENPETTTIQLISYLPVGVQAEELILFKKCRSRSVFESGTPE